MALQSSSISAVIPAFNSGRYLADAVQSIWAQHRPVSEIIVVDDGSTDDTPEVVRELGSGIRYARQANQGPSAARNRGVEKAQGEWIAFLDADDQWRPEKIAEQLAALAKHPELVLISSDMAETDSEGRVLVESVLDKHQLFGKFRSLDGRPVPNALAELTKKNFIPTGTVLVKKSAIENAGGFDKTLRYGEDLNLWAKIAADHPIACLPEVHLLRRKHSGNATWADGPMLEDLVKVMRNIRAWGADKLRSQNLDPDRAVANALANLGYWYFSVGNRHGALRAFRSSIRESSSIRALFYYSACLLPSPLLYALRQTKQNLMGTGGLN